jgi:hypothetical protein
MLDGHLRVAVFVCYILADMSTLTFDTLKFAERLEKAGLSREQAVAIAEAQKESLAEALDTALASRADLLDVKNELRLELSGIRGELASLKWMVGALIAIAIANFAKQFF